MWMVGEAEANCHRQFLEDLVRLERREPYQKEDFLSKQWQQDLWRDVASVEKVRFASKSPSSVIPSAPEAEAPFDLCVEWREKICEWKYKVVDCFDLDREVVTISMFFLDKYLEKHFVDEEVSLLTFIFTSLTPRYYDIHCNSHTASSNALVSYSYSSSN